jgi:hypothetical protein
MKLCDSDSVVKFATGNDRICLHTARYHGAENCVMPVSGVFGWRALVFRAQCNRVCVLGGGGQSGIEKKRRSGKRKSPDGADGGSHPHPLTVPTTKFS